MARPEIIKTELGQRLRLVREKSGDLTRDKFAQHLGFSAKTLANYERGDTQPDAQALAAYRQLVGVDANWLITGDGQPFQAQGDGLQVQSPGGSSDLALQAEDQPKWKYNASGFDYVIDHSPDMIRRAAETLLAERARPVNADGITDLDQPGLISLPLYKEVRPSAGPGSAPVNEIPTTRVAVEVPWLHALGVQPDKAVIMSAQGDSMHPTIINGSPMLVDTSKTEIQNGYIYVISVDGDLLVKRVRRRLDGRIELISDNRIYEPETLDDGELQQLRVIGRVFAAISKF